MSVTDNTQNTMQLSFQVIFALSKQFISFKSIIKKKTNVLRRYIISQDYIFYFQFYIYVYIHIHIIFCIYISDKITAEIQ